MATRLKSPRTIQRKNTHKENRPFQARIIETAPAPRLTRGQRIYARSRRVLEVLAALVLLVLTAPLWALTALGIKLTSRGPVIYTQMRIGRRGRPFVILKLRTMMDNCESLTGPRWCMPDDPRITWFGWFLRKSHLDELPQLINVLRGDMSLVGPRPERPEFVAELEQELPGYQGRHAVLPGITGLAQVQLPPDTDIDTVRRKLRYDLHYVRNFGFLMDLKLLACTVLRALGIPFAIAGRLLFVPGATTVEGPAHRTQSNAEMQTEERLAA
ncbi:MAG: sugar transferase [Gemmataceae bacterium]|nr:sugar transferase [Gemmataceae bacterium]MCI0739342.1 sugar transferase [Gemmataceae bacterium]